MILAQATHDYKLKQNMNFNYGDCIGVIGLIASAAILLFFFSEIQRKKNDIWEDFR